MPFLAASISALTMGDFASIRYIVMQISMTSLSMAAAAIPSVGVRLSKATLKQCRAAADAALAATTAADTKKAALAVLDPQD